MCYHGKWSVITGLVIFLVWFGLATPTLRADDQTGKSQVRTSQAHESSWERAGDETGEAAGAIGAATKETAGKAWYSTKKTSKNVWNATKRTSKRAWRATKEAVCDAVEAVTGD